MDSFTLNKKFIICILSGFLTGLSHHPLSMGFLSWFSLVPFFLALYSFTNYKRVIFASSLFGYTYTLTQIYWLAFNIGTTPTINKIILLSTSLYLTLFHILFGLCVFRAKNKSPWVGIWSIPFLWVSVEYIRSLGLLGFPWVSIGNSMTDFILPIQIVEYTAIYGVSFWIVLINVSIVHWLKYRQNYNIIIILVTFSIPFMIGKYLIKNHLDYPNNSGINITSIQPNIHLNDKHGVSPLENVEKIISITNEYITDTTNLLVWPETAVNTFINKNSRTEKILKNFLNYKKFDLLTGFPESEKSERGNFYFNSIGQFDSNGLIESYQKIHPVPVAEHIPLSSIFPSLKKINIGQANWEIGKNYTVFNTDNFLYSGVICYESTYPSLVRKFIKKGAQFLLVLVNDGWYETAPEPQQHANQSIFRAIENRRTIVRTANTGISMVILPSGKIVERSLLNQKTGFTEKVYPNKDLTFYTKYGDIFCMIVLLISIFLIKLDFKKR